MILIKKKITQIGYKGRCITLPKIYLDSLEEKGIKVDEMMMAINDDDSIQLTPIKLKAPKNSKKK